jgi:2,5-diketo-D-gluconate reductase B
MRIPQIGLGTWELNGDECTRTVALALELGYRHIDTAYNYHNHVAIKRGIEGFDRSQLFLTSKLSVEEQVDPHAIKESVRKALEVTLAELGTDYLDLYLIHWPREGVDLSQVYMAMELLQQEGKVRHVGVSNYTTNHLIDLIKNGGQPFANQVEFHPYLYQKDLLDFCVANQIQLISYRPFGKGKLLAEEPLFAKIGANYNKTGPQVILRWLSQKGIPVIPKASSTSHLKENLPIFDFSLSIDEMTLLDSLNRSKRFCKSNSVEFLY